MDYTITIDTKGFNHFSFECLEIVEDWIYSVRIESKLFNVYVENKKIRFKDDVITYLIKKFNELSVNGHYITTLSISPDEIFKRNLLKHGNGSGLVNPIVIDNNDNFDDERFKHLEDDIKTIKTKNAILENKLKFYENEINLIKSSLGL